MEKFIIATNNAHKREEIQRVLTPLGIELVTAKEMGFEPIDPVEDGDTFAANALIKAKAFCEHTGMPSIADDTGLCVDALGGAPGVMSARYAGNHDSAANVTKLLGELEGLPVEKRSAHFGCTVCCCWPDGRVVSADGRCDGYIGFEREGEGGFGYDCVFHTPDGRCFGTMTPQEKDEVSHRGNALREFVKLL